MKRIFFFEREIQRQNLRKERAKPIGQGMDLPLCLMSACHPLLWQEQVAVIAVVVLMDRIRCEGDLGDQTWSWIVEL